MPKIIPKVSSAEVASFAMRYRELIGDVHDMIDRGRLKGFAEVPSDTQIHEAQLLGAAISTLAATMFGARRIANEQTEFENKLRSALSA